jgi:Ca2+-binding RTX toxin-like protein
MQPDAFVFYDRHSGTAGGVASENPDAPQLVIGSDGHDHLAGGPNNDILVAATGTQVMTGGAGADTFVFGAGPTKATITDYTPGVDTLKYNSAGPVDPAHVHVQDGNTIVNIGQDQIVLAGVTVPHDQWAHLV